uniref:Nibrin n=1 Tax=Branchiostoma floridae TaxID=7739 RepID=C3YFG1_BRAFL|eukprot:XP_002604914.1 hypothetical protein BRAFLDRAFT_121621 [Branchiostoma floridae]
MWILSNISQADCEYNLLVDQEYQVGRKDCPILITGDSSISRKHAVLKVSHIEPNLGDHRKLPILTVQDLSKFGTLVGDQKVKGQAILKNDDVITFGAMGSKWKVHYQPLVVTSSMLDASLKRKLKQLLLKLGGHLVTEWHKECTHLVMSSVKVTVKTISAMVCCKPIVPPNFFQKMLEAASSQAQMPDPEDFQPPVAETTINPNEVSFKSNRERRTLFKKLKFIFFPPKQLKHLGQVIRMGGGETVLMETPPPDWKNTLLGEGVVVLSCDAGTVTDPQQQKWIRDSTSFLTKNARRTIQESEIGLAVLHSSVDAYCNPEIDPGCLLFQSQAIPSQSLSQGAEVYVSNTESSQSQGPVPSGRSVITDSNVSALAGTSQVDTKETRPPKQETSAETKKAQPQKVTSVEAKKNQPVKVKVELSPPRKPMTRQMEGNGSSDEEEDLFGHGPKRDRRRQEIPGWEDDDDPFEMKPSNRETKETGAKVVEERGQGEGVASSHGNRKRQKEQEFSGSESDDPFEMRPSKKEAKESQSEVVEEMGQGEGVVSSHGNRKRPRQEEEEDEEKPVEEDQPSNLTTVDVVSLVVRKARLAQPRYTEETDDPNKTPVKNFKKFRKVPYIGMERGLPRIIGGTDLVVHVPSRVSNEMHNFWLDEMEDESQRAKAEEEEDDLFKLQTYIFTCFWEAQVDKIVSFIASVYTWKSYNDIVMHSYETKKVTAHWRHWVE